MKIDFKKIKKNVTTSVKQTARKVQPYLNVANDAASIAAQVQGGLTALGAMALVTKVTHSLVTNEGRYQRYWFSIPNEIQPYVHQVLSNYNFIIDNHRVGIETNNKFSVEVGPRSKEISTKVLKEASELLGNYIEWYFDQKESCGAINTKEKFQVFNSPVAENIWNDVKPFILEGDSRSILLNGPPGIGKSCVANYLAEKVGGRILSLSLSPAQNGHIAELIKFLSINTIVLNDVDRCKNLDQFLDHMETIRKEVKLLVLTSNKAIEFHQDGTKKMTLDSAFVRPQRIDEIYHITDIGLDPLFGALKELDPETQEKVKGWSIASKQELIKRIELRGIDRANIEDLMMREEFRDC